MFNLRGCHSLRLAIPGKFDSQKKEFMLTTSLSLFREKIRFVLYPFRSRLLRISLIYFLFLRVLRCFNSPSVFVSRHFLMKKSSHSEILGSILACSSPRLIAACHVLLNNLSQAIRLTVLLSKTFLSASFNIIRVSLDKKFIKFICYQILRNFMFLMTVKNFNF